MFFNTFTLYKECAEGAPEIFRKMNNKLLRWYRLPILLLATLLFMMLTPSEALAAGEQYHGGSGDGFTLLTSNLMRLDGSTLWKSYNDAAHENQDDTFSGDQNTVYMHGTNFTTGEQYKVSFYDAEGSLSADAHKLQTDSVYADGDDGGLSASCAFPSYLATADPGTWHAIVCAVAHTPPDTYNEAWVYELTDDSFTVEGSAIPEFPTVFTAIGVTGLCFGIYYWMRRKAYLKLYQN